MELGIGLERRIRGGLEEGYAENEGETPTNVLKHYRIHTNVFLIPNFMGIPQTARNG